MSGTLTRCGSLENTKFLMTLAWSGSWSNDTLEGRRGSVNLWSNNKKLMTNNERLVNYDACDLIMLSKQSP